MSRAARARAAAGMVGVFGVALGTPAAAQVRASERATVSQTVDGTVLTVDYARPQARGRAPLFGKVVHWGEVWTPGANWATTLDVSRDVTLDGHDVKKGKYSLWFVVRPNEWTVVLDPRHQRYHAEPPDSTAEQVRWRVRPRQGADAEILTWSFPEVRPDGARLLFQWGTYRVALDATVRPSHPLPIARADAEPFLGTYRWAWDSAGKAEPAGTVELYYEGGMIKQRYDPFPTWYRALQGQPMVRVNDAWLIPAIVRGGKVWEMVADQIFEFVVKDGKAVGFEMRDDKDILLGKGERVTKP